MNETEKMKGMEEIMRECDHFLGTYREALPRVARRGLQPLLDLLTKYCGKEPIEIFRCPVTEGGIRLLDGSEAVAYREVVWGPVSGMEEMGFGCAVRPNVYIPQAILAALGLDVFMKEYRLVTLEELIEVGVQPWEIVENVRKLADRSEFVLATQRATQKMAQA